MLVGLDEVASIAEDMLMSKRDARAASSLGFRISDSSVAPLERITGTWKLFAMAVSLRKAERSLILGFPFRVISGFTSISNEAAVFEANSASALSKKRLRSSVGKLSMSTPVSYTHLRAHET